MTIHLNTQDDLEEAIAMLVKRDPRLKPVLERAGMPSLRRREPGFVGLAHIVCGQQLSTASASAIWDRLTKALDPFDHQAVRRARTDRLGRLGLSGAKIKTLKNLARQLASGHINLDVLAEEDADAAHHTLTAIHGIGPWTADIYIMFALARRDAFASGDLALQLAVQHHFRLKTRPTASELEHIAERWRPSRAVAAHLLWADYAYARRSLLQNPEKKRVINSRKALK